MRPARATTCLEATPSEPVGHPGCRHELENQRASGILREIRVDPDLPGAEGGYSGVPLTRKNIRAGGLLAELQVALIDSELSSTSH